MLMYTITAYEKGNPEMKHVFKVYKNRRSRDSSAYEVELDGEFFTTGESRKDCIEEIMLHIAYMEWLHLIPM